MEELQTHVFILWNGVACLSIQIGDQKQHSNPDFSSKSDIRTFQICVNAAMSTAGVK